MCHLRDLPEDSSKGFAVAQDAVYADIILVRKRSHVFAYRNQCPHTGAPMEWQADQFLDVMSTHIICGIHGARFRIHDGYCIAGPCLGCSLTKVAVEVQDGWVVSRENLDSFCD
jgi:nitrite reductase/ring-hydroxylating ferredoxin subunit